MYKQSTSCLFAGLVCMAISIACGHTAYAHKIKVFARAEGRTVIGSVYFPGGGKAANVAVEVLGPDGTKLGAAATDANGKFTFQAALRCDHTFVVKTIDGHRAEYTLKAGELPSTLPAPEGEIAGNAEPRSIPAPMERKEAGLEQLVERAVARQIGPLREQLDRQEARSRLRDILGGIGYIFGIAGVAFYLLGRRQKFGPQ